MNEQDQIGAKKIRTEDEEAEATGRMMAQQEKVRIRIPLNPLNEEDTIVPVCVNGYHYWLRRGESTEVPKTVAEILENASYI